MRILPLTIAAAPMLLFATHAPMSSSAANARPVQDGMAAPVLRTGTPVALRTTEALTTRGKKLKTGHRIQMEVAEPVLLNGAVLIPAGSPATGEVTDVRNKGMWGKSGRINARVLYATVEGRQIRLSGAFDDRGTTGTAGVVASALLAPIAGFFVTGTSASIPIGSPVKGFLDEDVPDSAS